MELISNTIKNLSKIHCQQVINLLRHCKLANKIQIKNSKSKMQSISPAFRLPITDITGGLIDYQMGPGRCNVQEMDMMDCLEANGLDRGIKKCARLIEDFRECHTLTKQTKRIVAMRDVRERKIANGELKPPNQYVTPRIDSY